MMQWTMLLGLSALLGAATALWHPHRPSFIRRMVPPDAVTVETARRWGGHVLWIDARGEKAYRRGHIDGALRLTESEWEQLLPAVRQAWAGAGLSHLETSPSPEVPEEGMGGLVDRAIVVYREDESSDGLTRIADLLREVFPDSAIFTLAGGWEAWRAGGEGRR